MYLKKDSLAGIDQTSKISAPDPAFTLYFCLMFCLYTNTYVQLTIQLALLVYVGFPYLIMLLSNLRRIKQDLPRMTEFLLWEGLFTLLVLTSKLWSYSTPEGSKTAITVFRIFVMGFAIYLYCDSEKKTMQVFMAFVIGVIVMSAVAFITSPVSSYGSEYGFGELIGQHRNLIGAVAAPLAFLCFWLFRLKRIKWCIVACIYLSAVTFITGSRTSIIQLLFLVFLGTLFTGKDLKKRLVMCGLLSIGILLIVYFVPFFHRVIWERFMNAVLTAAGVKVADTSFEGRGLYKQLAWIMFRQRPLLGFGLDGFICYLRDHRDIMGHALEATYAHCNYAELAADFGMLGLLVWYVPVFSVFVRIVKTRKNSLWNLMLMCALFSMIICDYSRIPWETHLHMYLWFLIFLLCRYGCKPQTGTTGV